MIKYPHLERLGKKEVDGITNGMVHIFPKLDGSNASIWREDGEVHVGTRNNDVTHTDDNVGIKQYVVDNFVLWDKVATFFPNYVFYGEFLRHHNTHYQKDAYNKFYLFDMFNIFTGAFIPYDNLQAFAEFFGIEFVPRIAVLNDPVIDDWNVFKDQARFLLEDGETPEGIVLKNYEWRNRFGHYTSAKVIFNGFSERKETPKPKQIVDDTQETQIAEEYATDHFIKKEYAKILEGYDGFIPPGIQGRLIKQINTTLLEEEGDEIAERFPLFDTKKLNRAVIMRIKTVLPELF